MWRSGRPSGARGGPPRPRSPACPATAPRPARRAGPVRGLQVDPDHAAVLAEVVRQILEGKVLLPGRRRARAGSAWLIRSCPIVCSPGQDTAVRPYRVGHGLESRPTALARRPDRPGHRGQLRDRLVHRVELARHGAPVPLASRDPERGQDAADRIRALVPGAESSALRLDLASLDSVAARPSRGGAAGPAGQQRRGDGAAAAGAHRRRLRAAVRHQPPRPLRADRAAAADAAGRAAAPGW